MSTYADVSRGIQRIFKELREPLTIAALEAVFLQRFGKTIAEIAGISCVEYLQRKSNVFEYDPDEDRVFLHPSILAGPPIADPNLPKDEHFVVDEFERLIEDLGPVCYISALCGKFIQRNGVSVTSITNVRPLDLFKRHPDKFLILGGGNVSLTRLRDQPEVQALMHGHPKAKSNPRVQQEVQASVPEVITELDVVEEFRRLILQDGNQKVYISSLCGRFLQRYRKPVTAIISSRPADFLRKHPDVFELLGGGNVRLRDSSVNVESADQAPPTDRPFSDVSTSVASGRDSSRPDICLTRSAEPAPPSLMEFNDTVFNLVLDLVAPSEHSARLLTQAQQLARLLEERCFLSVENVAIGGVVGLGLATCSTPEVELTLFVDKLPDTDHANWLPHILETLVGVLEMTFSGQARGVCVEGIHATLILVDRMPGSPELHTKIFISPIFLSREHLFHCIRNSAPATQGYYSPALMHDAVQFIVNQPDATKDVMKLVTWWSSQQRWTTPSNQPPHYLLQLLCVYATLEQKDGTRNLTWMLGRVLDLCASFEQLRVVWADLGLATYTPAHVPQASLWQVPLVMDPTNPYVNLADPAVFNHTELAALAGTPGRLLCFAIEVQRPQASAGDFAIRGRMSA